MYLRSVDGKIIFEGRFSSLRQGVEMAVEAGINLTGINLRQANLSGARMDGAKMAKACFWGANLSGADMAGGDFTAADFRTANLLDTVLAESDCTRANFRGAYFSRTLVRECLLNQAEFSCPSIFSVDLADAASLDEAIYSHLGEVDCDLSHAPLIIRGLGRPLIFMDDSVLVGSNLVKIGLREQLSRELLAQITARQLF